MNKALGTFFLMSSVTSKRTAWLLKVSMNKAARKVTMPILCMWQLSRHFHPKKQLLKPPVLPKTIILANFVGSYLMLLNYHYKVFLSPFNRFWNSWCLLLSSFCSHILVLLKWHENWRRRHRHRHQQCYSVLSKSSPLWLLYLTFCSRAVRPRRG